MLFRCPPKLLILLSIFTVWCRAEAQSLAVLKVMVHDDVLSFQLDGGTDSEAWVLQQSGDGRLWGDVIFMEPSDNDDGLTIEIARKAIKGGAIRASLFRAVKYTGEDLAYRKFLQSRVKWRTEGPTSYTYVVRSNQGSLSSETRYTVVDGTTTMFEVISIFPPVFTPPADLTIDDWFEVIASAYEQGAVQIDVTWDPELGFPATGYIDLFLNLADEERGWMIREMTPLK